MADRVIVKRIKRVGLARYKIKINGAIFCQVNKITKIDQVKPSATTGNQK
jgi:hypothetical protein